MTQLPRITRTESVAAALSALTPAVLTYAAGRAAGVPAFGATFTWFIPPLGLCTAWLLLSRRPGYAAGYGLLYAAVLVICGLAGAAVRLVFPVSTLAVTEVASFIAACLMFLPVAASLYDERPAFAAAEAQQRLRERQQRQLSGGKGPGFAYLFVFIVSAGTLLLPVIVMAASLLLALAGS